MMRGNSGWAERSAEAYLPYLGHVAPGAVLLNDSSLLAMGRLRGVPHELASAAERNAGGAVPEWPMAQHRRRHGDRRRPSRSAPAGRGACPAATFHNQFAARLDQAYRGRVLQDRLYQNDWYLSVIVAPRTPAGGQATGRQLNKALARFRKHGGAVDAFSLALD